MRRPLAWPIAALLLAALAATAWWWLGSGESEARFRTARIEQGPLQAAVSAAGTVNPVVQVSVGSQVSGQIKELLADFNTEVKQGQLIARIDPESIRYRVRQASADVDAARAQALQQQANVLAVQAQVARARLDADNAARDLARQRELLDKSFISQAAFETVRNTAGTLAEQVKVVQAQWEVSRAQAASAQATVAQRAAALAQAQVDLNRTEIRSPVDGVVIKRSVSVGQTVAASLQAPELFIIARNLSDMQVEVAIDEADIGRVRVGQPVSFTVDAFPGRTYDGVVGAVRKAALTTANVVTYTVVVGFTNDGAQVLPGMTANVRIVTDSRDSVVKLPNAALRVRLPGEATGAGSQAAGAQRAAGRASGARAAGSAASSFGAGAGANAGAGAGAGPAAADAAAAAGAANATTRGRVYVLGADGAPRAVAVSVGISDGSMSELLGGELQVGQEVVTGTVAPAGAGGPGGARGGGPRMGFL